MTMVISFKGQRKYTMGEEFKGGSADDYGTKIPDNGGAWYAEESYWNSKTGRTDVTICNYPGIKPTV